MKLFYVVKGGNLHLSFKNRKVDLYVCVCVCVCAVSYTHLTLPTRRTV